jgi:hypothetical protein
VVEVVAETIRLAAEVGLVRCTIEDATGNLDSPVYDERLAVERIAAAAEAARTLRFPFTLTARAHNFLYAAPSLDDRTFVATGVGVEANRATTVDPKLEVGVIEARVEVNGESSDLLTKDGPLRGGNFQPTELLNGNPRASHNNHLDAWPPRVTLICHRNGGRDRGYCAPVSWRLPISLRPCGSGASSRPTAG